MNGIWKRFAAGILAACLAFLPGTVLLADTGSGGGEAADEETEAITVEIRTVDDLLALAENCRNDSYSIGKVFALTADLDLSETEDFAGIPYFNGTLYGNGHTISGVSIARDGSEYGFFRYVGKSGTVFSLHVSGSIAMTGSQENIGGIAGVNYGTISGCSFQGSVSGETAVGAIAGTNKSSGIITGCSSGAVVLGTNHTGGIAGRNEGLIHACVNEGSVNVEELDMTLDLGGVDLGTLNLLQSVAVKNNTGGICGYSTGIISDCENSGTVGYPHTGYNVGGIVGAQSGKVVGCTNRGQVNGRKDVGGIVGQAEPYMEREYLEERINETSDQINQLNRTLNGISETVGQTSAQVKEYTDSLVSISDNISQLTGLADTSDPETKEYVDNINQAWDTIGAITAEGDGVTEEQRDRITDALSVISDNLTDLQNQGSLSEEISSADSAEELVAGLSETWNGSSGSTASVSDIVDMIDSGIQSVNDGVQSAVSQINEIADGIASDLDILTGEEDYIKDISSVETAETTDGVILGCANEGAVSGDLNVGGIAGTMNIEYDVDPELDLDFTGSVNVTIRATVNVVILYCVNTGDVTAKKSAAGGIAGVQALGFVYDCEGYGAVAVESGSYLGGIAGKSDAAVRKCYSQCMLTGSDYVGGIAGSGNIVTDSIALCTIAADGERIGAVAGYLQEEGSAEGNYFVNEAYGGIDNINYAGLAECVSYEEVMAMEDIPEGFAQVLITFQLEEETLSRITIPYGEEVSSEDFPGIPEKEGYYVVWDNEERCGAAVENLVLTASYVPWMESVAAEERSGDGRALVLAVGSFYEDTVMLLTETEGPDASSEDGTLLYAYDWALVNEEGQEPETVKLHLYAGEEISRAVFMAKLDGTWQEIDAAEDGSYLVAEVSCRTPVAVVVKQGFFREFYLIGAGIFLVLMAAFVLLRRKAKRKRSSENG